MNTIYPEDKYYRFQFDFFMNHIENHTHFFYNTLNEEFRSNDDAVTFSTTMLTMDAPCWIPTGDFLLVRHGSCETITNTYYRG